MKRFQDISAAIVLAHILITGFDHLAHQRIDLTFALTESVFLLFVITTCPFVAAVLLWTRYQRAGGILFFSTMAVAFAFNVYHRYWTPHASTHSPDFEWYWETIFTVTTALILLTEVTGCWVGMRIMRLLGTSKEISPSNS